VAHVFPVLATGGLARHAANLARLSKLECESLLVSIFEDPRSAPHPLPKRLRVSPLRIDPRTFKNRSAITSAIVEAVTDFRPDVVHSYHYFSDLYAIEAARHLGIPAIRSVHGISQLSEEDGFAKSQVRYDWSPDELREELALEHLCTATIVVASWLKDRLVQYGFDAKKILVLRDGVDSCYFSAAFRKRARDRVRTYFRVPTDTVLVGFVGRLDPAKNPFEILDICRELEEPFSMFVVGDDELVSSITSKAEEQGLGGRMFVHRNTKNVRLAYAAFDLLLMTSLTEGMPNVALEAMAQEIPIVAPNVGGLPELLTSHLQRFLYQSRDIRGAVDRIQLLADPASRARAGSQCRAIVEENFALDPRMGQLVEVYRQASQGRTPVLISSTSRR
jgi:glycosyltransferase involved in cell wall biosynthesis